MQIIHSEDAPAAIGPYSQAVKVGKTIYISGQIALIPKTGELVEGGVQAQAHQVFQNLDAIARAGGGQLKQIVKLNIYMTNLGEFNLINEIMKEFFTEPYPARATIGVNALPRQAEVEVDAILQLD